jgi:hypothetical protein
MKENEKQTIKIHVKWDNWNSLLLTSKIFRISEKNKVEIEIKVKPGSIELLYGIFYSTMHLATMYGLFRMIDDIAKYIRERRAKHREKTKKRLPKATITYFDFEKGKYIKIEV